MPMSGYQGPCSRARVRPSSEVSQRETWQTASMANSARDVRDEGCSMFVINKSGIVGKPEALVPISTHSSRIGNGCERVRQVCLCQISREFELRGCEANSRPQGLKASRTEGSAVPLAFGPWELPKPLLYAKIRRSDPNSGFDRTKAPAAKSVRVHRYQSSGLRAGSQE